MEDQQIITQIPVSNESRAGASDPSAYIELHKGKVGHLPSEVADVVELTDAFKITYKTTRDPETITVERGAVVERDALEPTTEEITFAGPSDTEEVLFTEAYSQYSDARIAAGACGIVHTRLGGHIEQIKRVFHPPKHELPKELAVNISIDELTALLTSFKLSEEDIQDMLNITHDELKSACATHRWNGCPHCGSEDIKTRHPKVKNDTVKIIDCSNCNKYAVAPEDRKLQSHDPELADCVAQLQPVTTNTQQYQLKRCPACGFYTAQE